MAAEGGVAGSQVGDPPCARPLAWSAEGLFRHMIGMLVAIMLLIVISTSMLSFR
jgi:hypothetical protein